MEGSTAALTVSKAPLDGHVDALASRLSGELIGPDDPGYDEARRVWNGMIDRRRALIARCTDVFDVVATIQDAREHGLALAVRGGGHNVSGWAVADDAVVCDLSKLRRVEVDAERRIVRAEPGATWSDVDRATQRYGLAVPGGVISTTGIAGLTLSGGLSWQRRAHGMTIDNLLACEVVTADGRILRASESENEDLFWALRGGGGNFGVVTSFEFAAHPLGPEVAFVQTLYPLEAGPEVFQPPIADELLERDNTIQTFGPGGIPALARDATMYGEAPPSSRRSVARVVRRLVRALSSRAFGQRSPASRERGCTPGCRAIQASNSDFARPLRRGPSRSPSRSSWSSLIRAIRSTRPKATHASGGRGWASAASFVDSRGTGGRPRNASTQPGPQRSDDGYQATPASTPLASLRRARETRGSSADEWVTRGRDRRSRPPRCPSAALARTVHQSSAVVRW
jgi:FAD binding domain